MSKSQEIEKRLLEVDGSLFQNVCDAILYYTEYDYPNIFRSGSKTGKVKTIKGTPDTFFMLPNSKYILVEYTTHSSTNKKRFLKKIKDDIDKCLNESKTGITVKDIEKIIYCCNSAITIKESKELLDYCRQKGVRLDFKGIHTLARMLVGRCAQVAKEFLQVSVDTGQILTPAVFADEYEASGLATKLTNEFMHRESEITALIASIHSGSKITIITGPPGVGKSKLAMQAFKQINEREPRYEVFCITNKNANIHEDLRTYLAEDKNYLILVDDANRQSDHFQSILYMLNEKRKCKIHVLVTVRDYALEDILLRCKGFEADTVAVASFTDEELTAILRSSDFNITNQAIKRVLEISNGNPRLAIMATKVALDANDVNALSDVSNIYDLYFQGAIGDNRIFSDKDIFKTLGLLSFFFSFDLDDTEFINHLTTTFGIDVYKFKDALVEIEKLELAETTADFSMIKVGDQVLATYFFYKTFIKEEVLDFRIVMRHYFSSHLRRIKDSIIPANNTFTYKNVYPKIDPILTEFWPEISSDKDKAFQFLNMFWFYRSDDTFAFVASKISDSEMPTIPEYIYDKKANQYSHKQDEYLRLLANFFTQPVDEIKTAIELSFEYVERLPLTYTQLMDSIKSTFIFRYEDEQYSHFRQLALWDLIVSKAKNKQSIYVQAYFHLAAELMKPSFHVSSAGRKANTISMYNFSVRLMQGVVTFRKLTWDFLLENFDLYPKLSIEFLLRYLERSPDKVKDIYEFDLVYLLSIFDTYFTNSSFANCYIVQDLIYWFRRVEINHPRFIGLKQTFTNKAYRYYVLLSWNRLRDKFDYNYEYRDFDKYDRLKGAEIRKAFNFKELKDFEDFYPVFLEVYNWKENELYQFKNSLNIILGQSFTNSPQLAFDILQELINSDNQSGVVPYDVYRIMWVEPELSQRLFESILNGVFNSRTSWMLGFLNFAPVEHLNDTHVEELVNLFRATTDFIYLDVNLVHKLMAMRPDLYLVLIEIIVQRIESEEGNFMIDQHFFKNDMKYVNDILLIKKAYYQQDQINQHFDHNFEGLLEIVKIDNAFFLEYVTAITYSKMGVHSSDYTHLHVIWQIPNAEVLLADVLDYITGLDLFVIDDAFANVFFNLLKEDEKDRARKFLMNYLNSNLHDINKVDMIMNIARHSFRTDEDDFILQFLIGNPDYEFFTQVSWHNNYFMGNGNTIWADIKASRWEEILTIFEKITVRPYRYSKHKNYVKGSIASEKRSADGERRHIFMYGD